MGPQRYSKTYLRQLAVIFSSYQILYLEKNNLVQRKNTCGCEDKTLFDDDLPFDLENNEHMSLINDIRKIENIVLSILKAAKQLHKKDEDFFISRNEKLIEAFLESGIIKSGVSPHMSFVIMLFTYFVDGKAKKISFDFIKLCEISLYETILLRTEESRVFNWGQHTDAVYTALHRGVGFPIRESNPWEKIVISHYTFLENNFDENEAKKIFAVAKRSCGVKLHQIPGTLNKIEGIYLKDLISVAENILSDKSCSKFKHNIFSRIYDLLKSIKNKEVASWSG